MTKEELEIRIEKKNKDIEKIYKRINKWTSGMNDEAKKLCSDCEVTCDDPTYKIVRQAWSEYKQKNWDDPTVFRQDYENKGPNFQEAYSAYRDLADQKETLNKYKNQLNKLNSFTESEKIKVIWDFLMDWKEKAYTYYTNNVKEYSNLKLNYDKVRKNYFSSEDVTKEINSAPINRKQTVIVHLTNDFNGKYYRNIDTLTKNIYLGQGRWDDDRLKKILDKEVQNKYTKFISQIEGKAGKITDAEGLRIGGKGEINGYIIGDKNKVHVETITAGGYNIQCLHYRTLVNIVK